MAIPKQENIWGTLQTKNGFKFVITYNLTKNNYTLYSKINSQLNKITSSKDANELLKKIQEYEVEK